MIDTPDPQSSDTLYTVYEDAQQALGHWPLPDWSDWSGSAIVEFWFGIRFPRKIRRLVDRVYSGACTRAIWVGPRGGGKSQTDAILEYLLWFFRDFDVVNVGGSEKQAKNVYGYLQGFMQQYRDAYAEMTRGAFPALGGQAPSLALSKQTMELTVRPVDPSRLASHSPVLLGDDGEPLAFTGPVMAKDSKAFVAVLSASQKQVRGPHAGSERRGGALFIDEEAEVPADISTASRYMVNTAVPSVIIRTSTNHNAIGTFAEDIEDPDAKGLEKYATSIFDVVHTCPYAITTPEQWQAIEDGTARAPGDEHKLVRHLPVMQPDCTACPRPSAFRDRRERYDSQTGTLKEVKPPLCAGAAAFAENGWIPFDGPGGLLAQYDESPSVEEFEVELCGSSPSVSGLVIKDRAALTRAIVPDELCVFVPLSQGGGECVGMIDWGLAGTCAVMLLQNRYDMNSPAGRRVILEVEDLGKQSDSVVYQQMEDWRVQYGMQEVWADASHPYPNYNLTLKGFHVTAVEFAKQKALGVGSINGHLEGDALWIPAEKGKALVKQLKGWRKSDSGQIVKKNDHFPDSLLCGLLKYRDLVMTTIATSRAAVPREAGQANTEAAAHLPVVGSVSAGGVVQGAQRRQRGTVPVPGLPRAREISGASAMQGAPMAGPQLNVPPLPAPRVMPTVPPQTPPVPLAGPQEVFAPPVNETTMQRIMREARESADNVGRKPQ